MLRVLLMWLLAVPGATRAGHVEVGSLRLDAPPGYERQLERLAARARDILPRLEADLGVGAAAPFRLTLVPPGPVRDPELALLDGAAPRWAAGYLVPDRRRGGIRLAKAARYPYGTLESVLAHEVVHMLLHDATGGALPRWFEEGVAMWQDRRWRLTDAFFYSSGLLTSSPPRLADLDPAFGSSESSARFGYAASVSFVSWAVRAHGDSLVPRLVRAAGRRPFEATWQSVTGGALADDEEAWRRDSLVGYRWLPLLVSSSTFWLAVALLSVLAAARRRARIRAVRAAWVEEERRLGEWDPDRADREDEPSPEVPEARDDRPTNR